MLIEKSESVNANGDPVFTIAAINGEIANKFPANLKAHMKRLNYG